MGILSSILKFLGGKAEKDEEAETGSLIHPVLLQARRQNHYPGNGDYSTSTSSFERLRKILLIHKLLYNGSKKLSQKLLNIIIFKRKPANADQEPILPVTNRAPGNITSSNDPLLVQTLLISSPIIDEEFDHSCVVDVPSHEQWSPEENHSPGTIMHMDDVIISIRPDFTNPFAHASASEEIIESAVFVEPQNYAPICLGVSDQKDDKKKKKRRKKKRKDQNIESSVSNVVIDEGRIRWIKHYNSCHRILIVGDGDFSFSACLAVAFGCASNIVATSLDSQEFLEKNYQKFMSNIKELRSRGCKVMHEIDATKMASHELLGHLRFDRIVYNFPFAGFFKDLSRKSQLRRHRKLVSQFMKNAKEMLSENGEIHISHKTNEFHDEWKLESVASTHRLRLIEAVDFDILDYPGYNTKCGFGGDNNFNCYPSKTYKFGLKMARY